MTSKISQQAAGTILLIGASRGLGHAMAAEFLRKGWTVIGTVRGTGQTLLHGLADAYRERLEIEQLDVTEPDQIADLRDRLEDRRFDILFVNASTANADRAQTIDGSSTDEFTRVMLTNALSPIRIIDALQELVTPAGMIGIMSSGQGSIPTTSTSCCSSKTSNGHYGLSANARPRRPVAPPGMRRAILQFSLTRIQKRGLCGELIRDGSASIGAVTD